MLKFIFMYTLCALGWKPLRYAVPLALVLWTLIILAGYGVGVLAGWW